MAKGMLHLNDYNFLVYFPIVGDSITQLMRHSLHRCNYSTHHVVLVTIAYIFIDNICMLVGVSRHSCWCCLLMDMGKMGEEEVIGKGGGRGRGNGGGRMHGSGNYGSNYVDNRGVVHESRREKVEEEEAAPNDDF